MQFGWSQQFFANSSATERKGEGCARAGQNFSSGSQKARGRLHKERSVDERGSRSFRGFCGQACCFDTIPQTTVFKLMPNKIIKITFRTVVGVGIMNTVAFV